MAFVDFDSYSAAGVVAACFVGQAFVGFVRLYSVHLAALVLHGSVDRRYVVVAPGRLVDLTFVDFVRLYFVHLVLHGFVDCLRVVADLFPGPFFCGLFFPNFSN